MGSYYLQHYPCVGLFPRILFPSATRPRGASEGDHVELGDPVPAGVGELGLQDPDLGYPRRGVC